MYFRDSREIFKEHMYERGIELNRIVPNNEAKHDDKLNCYLCKKLVINPLMCNNCEIFFCERCGFEDISRICSKCKDKKLTTHIPHL